MRKILLCMVGIVLVCGFLFRDNVSRLLLQARLPELAAFLNANSNTFFQAGLHYFNATAGGVYDIKKAGEYFQKAIDADPRNAMAYYQLARVKFAQGKIDESLAIVNKSLTLDKSFLKAYYIRALASGFKKKLDDAQKDFEYILSHDTTSQGLWAVYNDLAWIKFQKGDFAGVQEMAQKGLKKFPNNPWLLNSLGTAYLNIDQKKQANVLFSQALQAANKLTPQDWQEAYSANDPTGASDGLTRIRNMIQFNLKLTQE